MREVFILFFVYFIVFYIERLKFGEFVEVFYFANLIIMEIKLSQVCEFFDASNTRYLIIAKPQLI